MCLSGTPYYFIFNKFAFHTNAFTVIMALIYGVVGFSSSLLNIAIFKYGKISINRLIGTFLNLSLVSLFGFLILHETVSVYKVIGIAVIFAGVAVLFVHKRQSGAQTAQKNAEQKIGKTFIILSLIQAVLGVVGVVISKIYSTRPDLALNRNDFLIWDNIFMLTFALSAYWIYCAAVKKRTAQIPSAPAASTAAPLVNLPPDREVTPIIDVTTCSKAAPVADATGNTSATASVADATAPDSAVLPSSVQISSPFATAPTAESSPSSATAPENEAPPSAGSPSAAALKAAKRKTIILAVLLIAATSALGAVSAVLGFVGYETMSVSLQVPMSTGGGILFGSVAGRIFFKEAFTPQIIVGLIIVMAGSVLLGF
jgi:drug/metabolite transporter (DMT)-like permease